MLNEEYRSISIDTFHQCEKCQEKFGSEKSLKNHVRIFHIKPKTKKNLFNSKFRGTTDPILSTSTPILISPKNNSTENTDNENDLKVEIMNTASLINAPNEWKNSEITQEENSAVLKTSPILDNSKENRNIKTNPSPLKTPKKITTPMKNSEMTDENSTVFKTSLILNSPLENNSKENCINFMNNSRSPTIMESSQMTQNKNSTTFDHPKLEKSVLKIEIKICNLCFKVCNGKLELKKHIKNIHTLPKRKKKLEFKSWVDENIKLDDDLATAVVDENFREIDFTKKVSVSESSKSDDDAEGSSENKKSNKKPNMSYVALTALAIQNLPENKGTRQQIYDWIEESYPYFKTFDKKDNWTSAIRCSLNQNRAFHKDSEDIFQLDTNSKEYEVILKNWDSKKAGSGSQSSKKRPSEKNPSKIFKSKKIKLETSSGLQPNDVKNEIKSSIKKSKITNSKKILKKEDSQDISKISMAENINDEGSDYEQQIEETQPENLNNVQKKQEHYLENDSSSTSEKWKDLVLQPDDKSVICAFCGKTFSSKSDGKKHVYKKHKMSTKPHENFREIDFTKNFSKKPETEMEYSERKSNKNHDDDQSSSDSKLKESTVESDSENSYGNPISRKISTGEDSINNIDSEIISKEPSSESADSVSKTFGGKTTCNICGKSFFNKTNAKKHYKKCSKCLICGKMNFKNKIARNLHVENIHKMSKKEYNEKFPQDAMTFGKDVDKDNSETKIKKINHKVSKKKDYYNEKFPQDLNLGNNDEMDKNPGTTKINKIKSSHTRSAPALVNVWGSPWGWVTPEGVPKSSKAKNCNFCKKVFNPRDNKQSVSYHLDKCGQFYQFATDGKKCALCQKDDFKSYGRLLSHIENEHKDSLEKEENPTKNEIKSEQEIVIDKNEVEASDSESSYFYKENNTL